MRILLSCGILTVAIVAMAGCSRSADAEDASAASKQTASEIPKEADIFAVTMWTQTPPTATEAIARGISRSTTRTTTAEGGSSTQPAATCWVFLAAQDKYWDGKYKVTDNDVREMLKTYHRVSQEQWKNFSHVWGGDLGGWVILNDGGCVQWMMKPGGLGWLRFSTGEMIYLSYTAPPRNVATSREATQQVTSVPSSRPIVQMWNGGIYLAGIKPFLLFAAWENGTVLVRRSLDERSIPRKETLFLGKAKEQDIKDLLKMAEDAGFFDPPIKSAVVQPDGPDFVITIHHGGKVGMLEYHGGDPKLDEIGPNASPSRTQMQAFYDLWRKVEASIRDCPVSGLSEFKGEAPTLQR